ncbi:MAG: ribosome small subunit-dependent GTPase A [Microbacter sp.]
MEGIVIKTTGQTYRVLTSDGIVVDCTLKGNFRLKSISTTSPVVIGDHVVIEPNNSNSFVITSIDPRRNEVVRRSSNLSKQAHIIASNIDLAALVVTVNYPPTSTVFIDRFLAAVESFKIPAMLIVNKMDVYNEVEKEEVLKLQTIYESIDYPVLTLSAQTGEGIDALKDGLHDKITLFSGNSGVGKSSIINCLIPDVDIRINSISTYHNRGMHTTTFSEMFALPFGGYVIDTPGIKGFGMVDMMPEEVSHYFREMFALSSQCRYSNCTHLHEPGCAVMEAFERGLIHPSRYASYVSIFEEFEKGKYR